MAKVTYKGMRGEDRGFYRHGGTRFNINEPVEVPDEQVEELQAIKGHKFVVEDESGDDEPRSRLEPASNVNDETEE